MPGVRSSSDSYASVYLVMYCPFDALTLIEGPTRDWVPQFGKIDFCLLPVVSISESNFFLYDRETERGSYLFIRFGVNPPSLYYLALFPLG